MPVNRRQRRRPAAQLLAEIPLEVVFDFASGHTFPDVHPTIDEFQDDWEPVAEEFVAKWIEEQPGSRPFGWWLNHGKERPIVNPCNGAFEDQQRASARFGCLYGDVWIGPHKNDGWWQQNSFLYLIEHNLLHPGERERATWLEQYTREQCIMSDIGWCHKTEPDSKKLITMLRDNPKVAWMYFRDLAKQYEIPRP